MEKRKKYGSYARGDFDRESDIDFVAIVKGERLELQRKLKSVWKESNELSLEYEIVLSPTVIPYHEFTKWNKDLPYYSFIEKEGVRRTCTSLIPVCGMIIRKSICLMTFEKCFLQ